MLCWQNLITILPYIVLPYRGLRPDGDNEKFCDFLQKNYRILVVAGMAAAALTALYVHIPFCASLCHYCDFAKTANYHDELVKRYFQRLHAHLALWCAHLPRETRFASVYFGGGTPSLFSTQFAPLLALCAERLAPDGEITLEANPQDITREKLTCWQALGINRLSLGVANFQHSAFAFFAAHAYRSTGTSRGVAGG